ncbi:MAG: fluoride efflux transporter CrcB [Steroidobacteraceae bacterium]
MNLISTCLWVALGGALGSVARFLCIEWVQSRWATFPWGTLVVNVLGSFVIGGLAAMSSTDRVQLTMDGRQFLMTGVLGGFTTFSSFSLQTLMLARSGDWFGAGANIVASVVLCLLAAWCGFAMLSLAMRA